MVAHNHIVGNPMSGLMCFGFGLIVMVLLSTHNICFGCKVISIISITLSYLKAWAGIT